MQPNFLKQGPPLAAEADAAPAKVVQPLPKPAADPGEISPNKQHHLGQPMVRLRKPPGLALPSEVPQRLPGLVQLPPEKAQHPPHQSLQVGVVLQKIRMLTQIP